MSTLRELKDLNCRITLHCAAMVALCSHSWTPSWDQMIQYFGLDFDLAGDRSLMQRLVCEKCGGRGATVIILPAHDPRTQGVGGWQNHVQPSAEAMARIHLDGERARIAISAQVEANIERRRQASEERKARKAIESGRDLIGPPDPRAGRKRGRRL